MYDDFKSLKERGQVLLFMEELGVKNFEEYKNECEDLLCQLKGSYQTELITELTTRALELEVKNINSRVLRFFHTLLNYKISNTFQAPFLIRYTPSDARKRYVWEMQFKLDGILYQLKP